jgi:hypothetical protein
LTDILRNIGEQIRHRRTKALSAVQMLASVLLLQVILGYLWQFWGTVDVVWTLPLFMLQTAAAGSLALCAQLVRVETASAKTAEGQYWENSFVLFLFWAAAPLISAVFYAAADILDNTFVFLRFGVVALLVSLAVINKKAFHLCVLSLLFGVLMFGNIAFFFDLIGND